jgi:glycosyltransferase involved in cell wall biosynthesis
MGRQGVTDPRPTILIIGPTPPPYHGVAMMTQNLLQGGIDGPIRMFHVELADRRGIQYIDHPDFHDILLFVRQWWNFLYLLFRERPGVVHLSISQSTVGFIRDCFFLWPAYWRKSRVVIHLHGSHLLQWYETLFFPLKPFVKRTLHRSTTFIILGESLRPLFQGLVPEERIAVVPNGVAWGPIPAGVPPSPRKGRRYRILHLSTLCRQKGVLVVLEAIPFLIQRYRNVEFVFAGSWLRDEDRRAAENLIERTGLKDYVTFTGPVAGTEKQDLFHSADLFVFPGIQPEGQPLVLIEAMAAGLPILFTDQGCAGETVIDGSSGRKVKIGDSQDLAQKILELLEQPNVIRQMSKQSRLRYEAHYTDAHFRKRMTEVIFQAWEEGKR